MKILQTLLRFLGRVQGQSRRVLRCFLFVMEFRVFFLQVTGIGQKDAAQFDRCLGGVDLTAKPAFHQARNPSGMIEMSMGKNNGVDGACRNGQVLPIVLTPLFLPLKEAAIYQNLNTIARAAITRGVDEVLGTGDPASCSQKLNVAHVLPNLAMRETSVSIMSGGLESKQRN